MMTLDQQKDKWNEVVIYLDGGRQGVMPSARGV